jgi:hypothetical protein
MMTDPIALDGYREFGEQEATVLRRRLNGVEADQALRRHQKTVDRLRGLVALFAARSPSRDPRRIKFIAEVLEMLERLGEGDDFAVNAANREGGLGTAKLRFSADKCEEIGS